MIIQQRIYRDRNGKPTLDKEKAVSLLYAEGMVISDEQAAALPKEVTGEKAMKSAPEDKAMKGPAKK